MSTTNDKGAHWIDGEWVGAARSRCFALRSPGPGGVELGSWPRAGIDEARRSLDAADRESGPWFERGPLGRRESLAPMIGLLREQIRRATDPGLALGLEGVEAMGLLDRGEALVRAALDPFGAGCVDSEGPGVDLILADGSELAVPLAARVVSALGRGRGVVLLSSRAFPMAGMWIAEALDRAGLPAGLFAVLHGDGRESIDALLEVGGPGTTPPWAAVEAMPWDHRIEDLDRARVRPSAESGAPGLPRSFLVDGDGDFGAQARLLLRASWGRSSTLGGQIPGGYSRVLCPETSFSAFTEALLDPLDRWLRDPTESESLDGPSRADRSLRSHAPAMDGSPLPWFDESLLAHFEGALSLGLDEGSTLIFGGGTWSSCGGRGPVPRSTRVPAIFTNVEFRHRLPRLVRPAPLLCLLRVPRGKDPSIWAREFEREAKHISTDLPR